MAIKRTVAIKEYRKDKLVAVYSKIALTEERGFDPSNVRKVMNGTRNHVLGSTFKKLSDKEMRKISKTTGKVDFGRITARTLANKGITVK